MELKFKKIIENKDGRFIEFIGKEIIDAVIVKVSTQVLYEDVG